MKNLKNLFLLPAVFLLLGNQMMAQDYYYTLHTAKMPGVKSIENTDVTSYDSQGAILQTFKTLDSFDMSGNLIMKKNSRGGGWVYKHQTDDILASDIEFPDCKLSIAVHKAGDTTILSVKRIADDCNYPPPGPPMLIPRQYDSLFVGIARTLPNSTGLIAVEKAFNDPEQGKTSHLFYEKTWANPRALTLSAITWEERISKDLSIKRYFKVVQNQIVLMKQEVVDNYGGIVKEYSFDPFKPMNWLRAEDQYAPKYKYQFDKKGNWIKRLDGKVIVAERVIQYK